MGKEDIYGRVGAVIGIAIGIGILLIIGRDTFKIDPLIIGAIFGAGGAVTGGMLGETLYEMKNREPK